MLHPSYTDLMNAVNNSTENSEEPTINSRYSIVIAASRRARQLIDEKEKKGDNKCFKPLSVAVDELHRGDVRIVSEDDIPEDEIDLNRDIFADMEENEISEDITEEIAGEDDNQTESEVVADAELQDEESVMEEDAE